jgi:hypothetical protein
MRAIDADDSRELHVRCKGSRPSGQIGPAGVARGDAALERQLPVRAVARRRFEPGPRLRRQRAYALWRIRAIAVPGVGFRRSRAPPPHDDR